VIAVEYTSGSPELAAKIANKLADVYIGWQRTAKIAQTKDASTWLEAQIKALRKATAASEEAVEKFRASKGLYAGSNNVALGAQQLSELNSQLILADAQKSEAEARARLIKKMLADKGDIDATPEVLKSQLIINLIEQRVEVQRQLATLSATLLPSHPRIQQLKSELANVRAQIRDEAGKVVRSLENEAHVAAAREASLKASLNAAKTTSAGLGDSEIKLRALQREAKANRDLLDTYLARYRDASARHDMGAVPSQATIVSRAHASVLPSFPKRGPLTLLVMAAVALLSLAYVLARELISGTSTQTIPRPAQQTHRKHRRPAHTRPAAAESAPARPMQTPRPQPAAAATPEPRKPAEAAATSVPPARKLPVVIPGEPPVRAPHQAVAQTKATSEAKSEAPPEPSTPPSWQAKPAKRPSWLKVSAPRRTATESSTEPEAPTPPPEKAPEIPEPSEEAAPTVATAGLLLDRLKQEFPDSASKTASGSQGRKRTGFLDRFRRASSQDDSKPTSKGVEMSALSPNDLRHYLTQRIATSDVEDIPAAPKAGRGKVGPVLKSFDAVLDRVLSSATGGLPRALLVAGTSPKADATHTAINLARALVDRNEQVVLVDLAKGASTVSGPLGMPRVPGFAELAAGRATFADVIRVDEDTPLQVIPSGNPAIRGEDLEPDRFMRVFEALTQAYGCVILHADFHAVQALLPALKFELPAMVAVLPPRAQPDSEHEALSTFQALGCPVVVYEGNGKQSRFGLFSRTAAV